MADSGEAGFWVFLCQARRTSAFEAALLHAWEMPRGHVRWGVRPAGVICMWGAGGILWKMKGEYEGIQAQGVVVMTMTWVWTDGVQLMMNNYASFFLKILLFFFSLLLLWKLWPRPWFPGVWKNKKRLWWMETKWCCTESCSLRKQHSPQAGSLPFCNTCSLGHMYLIFHGWLFAALPSAANGTVLACARCIKAGAERRWWV